MAQEKVMVALSGGVDSALAAWLLQQQGYAVEALFMKNWEDDDDHGYCASQADRQDAEAICERLGIVLHTANFSAPYWHLVFERMLAEYARGRTPNPDVACNRKIKFDLLLQRALELGASRLATGHYAALEQQCGRSFLLRAKDRSKDQSYFLCRVAEQGLAKALFPLAGWHKKAVREQAQKLGLHVHAKQDSTGLCFIGERPFKAFLARYLAPCPGPIETIDGACIGRHDGLMYYTIGQRRGLSLGGINGDGRPWYVVGKRLQDKCLIVAQGPDHPALQHHRVAVESPHWIGDTPSLPLDCLVQLRYRQAAVAGRLHQQEGQLIADLATPVQAAAEGQVIAFYRQQHCLGGGFIARCWSLADTSER